MRKIVDYLKPGISGMCIALLLLSAAFIGGGLFAWGGSWVAFFILHCLPWPGAK